MVAEVRLDNVSFTYPNGQNAVNGVDLHIDAHEPVAIIGQNGAGKTTVARLLNGLLRPTKGRVFIEGKDSSQKTTAELSTSVGYVFQNPDDQIFSRTVEAEVSYSLHRLGLDKKSLDARVNHAIRLTNLEAFREVNPFDLPFTQRRFVTLAIAISLDPAFYILDEPTAGQDPIGMLLLLDIISQLSDSNRGVVVITHDMEFVAQRFSRVIVMASGRVIADGSPREIFARPDILDEASLKPPRMTSLAQKLGTKRTILTTAEMAKEVVSKAAGQNPTLLSRY